MGPAVARGRRFVSRASSPPSAIASRVSTSPLSIVRQVTANFLILLLELFKCKIYLLYNDSRSMSGSWTVLTCSTNLLSAVNNPNALGDCENLK